MTLKEELEICIREIEKVKKRYEEESNKYLKMLSEETLPKLKQIEEDLKKIDRE